MIESIKIGVSGQGLHDVTRQINTVINHSDINQGLCTVFVQHTSASLIIQENADPSAKRDLENWLNRLVVENDPLYTHTLEGTDDMPAHIKSSTIGCSLTVPVSQGSLAMGTWQGVYLNEHRNRGGSRTLLLTLQGE